MPSNRIDVRPPADRQTRLQDMQVRKIGNDDRRVSIAVSSETPVARGYGDEVLSHDAGAIDLAFFASGRAPLLLDHDPTRQIGVVENVKLGSDRVLRATVRLSTNPQASEVLTDLTDNIRCNVSIGYQILEWSELPDDSGYRITKWKPMEVSIVSIPADETVGVNRGYNTMPNDTTIVADLEARGNAIAEAIEMAARHNMRDKMDALLTPTLRAKPAEAIIAAARGLVLDNLNGKPLIDSRIGAPAIHNRDARQPSALNLIRSIASGNRRGAEFEHDIAAETTENARRIGMGPKNGGHLMPLGSLMPRLTGERSAVGTSGLSGLQFTDHLATEVIEPLRAVSQVFALGARPVAMTQNSVMPTADNFTSAWVGEGLAPADSVPTTGNVPFSYHGHRATGLFTAQALFQSSPILEDIFRMESAKTIAGAVDLAAINGSGASNQPRGILNVSGIGLVSIAANSGALTWAKVVELRKAVKIENVVGNKFGFLTNHNVEAAMLTVERASGTAKFILDDTAETIAGHPIRFSSNVPANGTKGTHTTADLSTLIYGNWSDLIIGVFGAVEVIVDPYTESAAGNVRISLGSAWDVNVRHPESFAAIRDIIA